MRVVYKYAIPSEDHFTIDLPRGAQILHVAAPRDSAQLWALVDPEADPERRTFRLAGTGHPITDPNLDHIGTFLLFGGSLVFHVFEVLP